MQSISQYLFIFFYSTIYLFVVPWCWKGSVRVRNLLGVEADPDGQVTEGLCRSDRPASRRAPGISRGLPRSGAQLGNFEKGAQVYYFVIG